MKLRPDGREWAGQLAPRGLPDTREAASHQRCKTIRTLMELQPLDVVMPDVGLRDWMLQLTDLESETCHSSGGRVEPGGRR